MNRTISLLSALVLAACGRGTADQFREGIPTADAVKVNVPAKAGQGLDGLGQRQDGLGEGNTADLYLVTRVVTLVINGGTLLTLGLVKAIVDQPPTSLSANQAVWGPHTDALSPNTYKMTVTKVSTDHYDYVLEGKGKTEADANYRAILSGSHVRTGDDLGSGTLLIDWNEAQKLPEHDKNVGTAEFVYSHEKATDDVKIDVTFTQVKDEPTGQLVNANYKYVATPANGGSFEFKSVKNFDADPSKTQLETMTIKSRWMQTGAGRSDVKLTAGDLGTVEATASECWDEGFASRYLNISYDPSRNYGSESVCAFASAEYSTLSL